MTSNTSDRANTCINGKNPVSEKVVGSAQRVRPELQLLYTAVSHGEIEWVSDHKNYEPGRNSWRHFTTNHRVIVLYKTNVFTYIVWVMLAVPAMTLDTLMSLKTQLLASSINSRSRFPTLVTKQCCDLPFHRWVDLWTGAHTGLRPWCPCQA